MRFLPLALGLSALAPAPQEKIFRDLNHALAEHGLLARLELTDLRGGDPFQVLAEPPRRPDAVHMQRVQALFVPWLGRLAATFEREVFAPGGLEPRDDAGELVLLVFGQAASFQNAARYAEGPVDGRARAQVWDNPPLIATWWDASLQRAPAVELRSPVLVAAAQRLLARCDHREPEARDADLWIVEGVAGYLAAHGSDATPETLEAPPLDPAALERLAPLLDAPARVAQALLSLAALVDIDAPGEFENAGASHARAGGLDVAGGTYFREQAALWTHFLLRAEGGRYAAATLEHLAAVLAGRAPSGNDLAQALGVGTLEELDTPFRAYLAAHAGADAPPDPSGPVLPSGGRFAARPRTAHEQRVAALALAIGGDLPAARALAAEALASSNAPALAQEVSRLEAALAAREAFVAALPGAGKRLRLQLGGRSRAVAVRALEDGELVLEKAVSGVERIAVDALSVAELAASMAGRGGGPPAVVAYLALLAGDERWSRSLADDDPDCAALEADAAELERLLPEANARAALLALGAAPAPETEQERASWLARAGEIIASHGETGSVRAVQAPLREAAAELLAASFAGEGLEERLSGDVERRADGLWRITYEFADASELADFVRADGYLADRLAKLPEVEVPPADWGVFVRGGNLEAVGDVALQHVLPMQAPVEVTYELLYGRSRPGKPRNATALVAVCDDRGGSYVGAWDLFDLEAIDLGTQHVELAYEEGERLVVAARSYPLELAHRGEEATLTVQGKVEQRAPTGARQAGTMLLWFHCDVPLAVRRLVVEGRPTEDAVDELRERWVARKLGELGLGKAR